MPQTPTIPLWNAWAAAITAGTSPPADLGSPRFYRGTVGPTIEPGYYLFGQVIEVPAGFLDGRDGVTVDGTIHCWARTPDGAERLYKWLRALLHNVPLTVAGSVAVAGLVSKAGPVPDTSRSAWQVIARYVAEPIDAAA